MFRNNSQSIRRAMICAVIALAVVLPDVATAGVLDKVKNRVTTTVTKAGTIISNVRENRPIASAVKRAGENLRNKIKDKLPDGPIANLVDQFNPLDQVQDVVGLIQHVNGDYVGFAGGWVGCQAECAIFREDLKDMFDAYLGIAERVPALQKRQGLVRNIKRMSGLVDVVPARALYPMWKALDGKIDNVKSSAAKIERLLETLPPLADMQAFAGSASDAVCDWADKDNHPVAEWAQGELEHVAWGFKSAADIIPDLEVKGEVGAEGGIAVANATAATGVGLKPTDYVKMILKTVAAVPEQVSWAIKLNILRAKAFCQVTN